MDCDTKAVGTGAAGPLTCSLCLDTFKEPVTIPCGHSFCMGCIGGHWDNLEARKKEVSCPLCLETFTVRPQVRKSVLLAELIEECKTRGQQAVTPKLSLTSEDIMCDVCTEEQTKADRSCLVCLASYCEPHLKPHLKNPVFQSHRLVPPVRHMEEKLCKVHLKPLEGFCRTDQTCICQMCTAQTHKGHEVVTLELERVQIEAKKAQLLKDVANTMEETGARIARAQETVSLIKCAASKERDVILGVLEEFQKVLMTSVESEERSLLVQAEEVLAGLEEKEKKLCQQRQKLEEVTSTDSISFIQVFQALKAVAEERTFFRTLTFDGAQSFTFPREAVRTVNTLMGVGQENGEEQSMAVSSPEDHDVLEEVTLNSNGQWISKPLLYDQSDHSANLEFPSYFLQYAHPVVFDADTAERFLVLAGNEVKRQSTPLDYADNVRRFTNCALVLGQGLPGVGRYYWEVEILSGYVSLGLAESYLNPKEIYEHCRLGRNNRTWCLRWNGQHLAAWSGKQETVIKHSHHKIGVFLTLINNRRTLTFCAVEPSRRRWLHTFHLSTDKCFYPAFYLESVGAHLRICPLTRG